MTKKTNQWTIPAFVLAGAAAGAYVGFLRPYMLRWGASEAEVRRIFPGDDILREAKISATHAITIRASAEQVWPWIVQLGQGRGGFYTFDWLENLAGIKINSADRILPEYQQLEIGDVIPLAPEGFGLSVAIMEPQRALVLFGDTRLDDSSIAPAVRPGDYLASSWGFYLYEPGEGITRLVERWKADWGANLANELAYRAFLEPAAFIMERGMLKGIKQRVEANLSNS